MWEIHKLSEICQIKGGKRLPAGHSLVNEQTEHPYIKARDIRGGKIRQGELQFLTKETQRFIKNYTVREGDVCITIVANIGDVGLVPNSLSGANLTENAVRLTSFISNCDSQYLALLLSQNSYKSLMELMAAGAAQAKLGIYKIEEIKIPLPPLPLQKRIAAVLSRYDALLENYQQQVATLEGLAQEVYREWFVRGRCPGAETEPEGELPAGWQRLKFTEVISVQSGGTPQTSQPNYWDGDVYWFSPGDVENSYYVLTTDKTITEEGLKNCNSKLYPVDTVVITARGTVGKCVLLGRPMAINQSNYALIGRSVSQYFTFFKTLEIAEGLQKEANGAVFSTITTDNFVRAEILVPDANSLAAFDNLVAPIFGAIRNHLEQSTTLRATRDALLPRLLSGQLTVHAAEVTLAA